MDRDSSPNCFDSEFSLLAFEQLIEVSFTTSSRWGYIALHIVWILSSHIACVRVEDGRREYLIFPFYASYSGSVNGKFAFTLCYNQVYSHSF